ncbi:MAG TPA: glycosyltransferase, partial [Vicinamibacterales bacterium]|nr:glycosyltransferase [Vicinamibacterales bacterium]
ILWLNAGLLLPLDKGGKLRTWHLMRHLAARHDITYLSFSDPSQTAADRQGMLEVCRRLETVPRVDPPKGTVRFYTDVAGYVLDPVPYAVAKYRSDAYRARMAELMREERYDAIVCDFLPPVVNMPDRLPCPAILFTHNVEAEIWRRHADTATNPVSRTLLGQQWQRMLRFEGAALSRFDMVLAVSDADRQTFARLYPGALRAPAHVVQTGVDTEYFRPLDAEVRLKPDAMKSAEVRLKPDATKNEVRPTHMVFTGSMDWLPNEDGMLYFVREILPLVRRAEPSATLSIIGRAPTPAVKRLADEPGIEVTGRVDDVRPHVAAGSVYVVPLRIGGGTRLKIFEAMAMGKAVVSTTIGAEGLPVTSGRDIVIADEPQRFADAVVALMRDPNARQRLEQAARALVVARYDWSAVANDFEDALARVCGKAELVGSM